MAAPVVLDGRSLTIADVVAVARGGASASADPAARTRLAASRAVVDRVVASGTTVYGINTGFGKLAHVRIPAEDVRRLQRNLIISHAAGVGDHLPVDIVRALMLLRANVLLMETSGVRPDLPDRVLALLNARIHPLVPEQGSVGASGDLAPLAHVALALIGEGEVLVSGDAGRGTRDELGSNSSSPVSRLSSAAALRAAGIEPFELEAKEGLAFINGTQAQTAILALLVHDARITETMRAIENDVLSSSKSL